jgi:hypothetical protein
MRARVFCSFVLAITIATSTADADEAATPAQPVAGAAPTLPMVELNTLVENGRPNNFYKLVLDEEPNVCGALDKALNKTHLATTGRGKDPARDLLLGSEYSIKWDEFKDDLGHPVSRADIDLNNDGRVDTVYRVVSVRGGPYLYGLVLTVDHPAAETLLSRERRKEISGGPVQDPRWGGISENTLFFTGPRWMKSTLEPIETIHPPLPAGMALPLSFIIDIVLIENRHYVIIGPAYYFKESPIRLFVFETRTPRDHSLVCYFESNFSLQKP